MNETIITPEVKADQLEVAAILEEHPDAAHDLMVFAQGYMAGKRAKSQAEEK